MPLSEFSIKTRLALVKLLCARKWLEKSHACCNTQFYKVTGLDT